MIQENKLCLKSLLRSLRILVKSNKLVWMEVLKQKITYKFMYLDCLLNLLFYPALEKIIKVENVLYLSFYDSYYYISIL